MNDYCIIICSGNIVIHLFNIYFVCYEIFKSKYLDAQQKLHAIIEGLELVLAKDQDFVATAKALRKAAEDNERNVAEYQRYTKDLNTWVEKQRNFSDSVKDLIKKLEELDKLRDYNNEFWADAKRNLMEAQNRLHASADFLQGEIQTLDQHFYNRLSETLSQLDVCIQAMVNKNNR